MQIRDRQSIRLLLIQIREDPETKAEELQEFIRYGKVQSTQIQVLDVLQTPDFSPDILANYDALLIGGSSDATVLNPQKFTFVPACERLLQATVDQSFPVFASCFGFQLLVQALGGTIIRDRPNLEMGVYPLFLTPEGQDDPLLRDLPNPFLAISGHQERASALPKLLVNLAFSEKCPYHAIKVRHKPIYGFQFHPEVDAQDLRSRLLRYQTRYLDNTEHTQNILDSLQETHEANQLIAKFIDHILLGKHV